MEIKIGLSNTSIIDDEDFEKIRNNSWSFSGGYAMRVQRDGNKRRGIYLHRVIMDCPEGLEVDHINGNKLDNRKSNLRICSHSENMKNQKSKKDKKNKYRGVSFYKKLNKWRCGIVLNRKQFFLGYFDSEIEAAKKYDEASLFYHKEFGVRNFK